MHLTIGHHDGPMDVKYPSESFILLLLQRVETGDGGSVEGDAWVCDGRDDHGFEEKGF